MSRRPHDRRLLTLLLAAAPWGATPALADAAPALVWGTYYEGQIDEYAGGAPAGLAPLADGVVVSHNAFIAAEGAAATALMRFDATGAFLGRSSYGGQGHGDGTLGGVASVAGLGLIYLAGDSTHDAGLTTPGAHQTHRECFGDGASCGEEGFVAQFDAAGELRWGTYFGGPFDERILGASADASGALHICGATDSPTGVATTGDPPAALLAGAVGFVARFDATGILQWAKYHHTVCLAAAADPEGGVVVAGNEPATGDEVYVGDDIRVTRFGATGEREWDATFGGDRLETVNAVAVAATGEVYVAGETYSREGLSTPGAHQELHGGGEESDAYVAKFSPGGDTEWATYFGGAAGEARPYAAVDLDGGLYLAVVTRSPGLATAGEAASPAGERDDVVLARFDGGGALVGSVYYGGEDDEVVTGLAVDSAGRIYLGGQTSSPSGIATSGAYQSELVDPPSMFLAMFREEPQAVTGRERVCVGRCAPGGSPGYHDPTTASPG